MALQAHHHHPSTMFFLNRNGQEGTDFSPELQKSQFPSITAGVDTRKRAREDYSVIDLETTAAPMNPPPCTPPQFISRRQTHNAVVSTGLRLSQGQSQSLEQRSSSSPMIDGNFAGEINRQADELDRFLQTQGEQLRCMLADTSERHYRELLRTREESVRRRLGEKEAEIEKATRHHAELEARVAQMEKEARAWQVRAGAKEAEAMSLQARLQQAVAHGGGVTAAAELESRSVDGVDDNEAGDAESAYVDPDRFELNGPSCRICRRRSATVLALPCRHLILCKECDGSVRVCPLCLCLKNSSVEVFFS
ncbi:SBP (S-ribonuclease binding protein) family protein [Raphanus sativus]|uniref:BOI-related E3 ubiquitin-protein ligase 1 n=1 Tax=Raphanus sativus TaxID=3726 RepID=A0A6J0KZF9_RAPSA|nr:BOI-related E3 ubiquitin-protein ligase 1 [Raphanus sativus]KAJ4878075.1 SBP (S-ribonuclease binding protein) family protein [Raphanus sativus]